MKQGINDLLQKLKAYDKCTYSHCVRTSAIAERIAVTMGLPHSDVEIIKDAALLHDVGKLDIPQSILNNPKKLSPEEKGKIEKHPANGAALLFKENYPPEYAEISLLHHIWYDGSGYPKFAQGKQNKKSLIVGLADSIDAMMSDRPYRKALSSDEITREITRGMGRQFDPTAAKAYLSMISSKSNVA